jgi:hypothetical protein
MKVLIALVLAAANIAPALAQPSVGISIGINQPGVYGRIHIGDLPGPALVLPQPVIIAPPTFAVERRPIYMYVPPAHQRDWRHNCGRYNACGQPVYFVHDQWVRDRYEHEHPGWNRGRHRGPDKRIHEQRGRGHDQGKGQGRERDRNDGHGRRD